MHQLSTILVCFSKHWLPYLRAMGEVAMACPSCGCKTTYQYDDEDAPDDSWERCAACGVVFHLDDHAPEDDEDTQ
jgi:uncharacterized Zn finger protein